MNSVLYLAKRNCLCYFRDKGSVFFSLLAALIVLMLYLLVLRNSLIEGNAFPGMDHTIDSWVLSGLLGIVSVTTCAGALQTMVSDRVENREVDILVTPMSPVKIAAGYILSTFIVGMMMSLFMLAIAIVYMTATGCAISATGVLEALLLTVPASLSGCVIMYTVTSFIKSNGAFSGFFTVISVLIGFVTGIYIPLSQMPDAMQVVSVFVPATQMSSLFRQTLAEPALMESLGGTPQLAEFRADLGFDLFLGDFQFTPIISILYVIGITAVFFAIAVIRMKKQ